MEGIGPKALRERERVVEAMRALATRIEKLPDEKLPHALPIAVAAVADLERRLELWLR